MEAGSYFLHLKEFVDCMLSDSVGKILQAFAKSIADFLAFYQSQIINFQNHADRRRLFEDILIFGENSRLSDHASILEIKIQLDSLLKKLKLLATICFT
jgi:hypothetical protein